MTPELQYDSEADAAYLRFQSLAGRNIARTEVLEVDLDRASINLDFDDAGQLVGVEFLGASRILPADVLEAAGRM